MIEIPIIGWADISIGIFYLIIIYALAFRIQQKKSEENPAYRFLLPALTLKILGAVSFVVISLFYYQKGDTFLYFQISEDLRIHLFEDFRETFTTLFTAYDGLSNLEFNPLEKYNYYYERTTTWNFGRIVLLFNLISFGSYLVSSILMGIVSFVGLWLGYITMCKLYQQTVKMMFIPFFLIPTALIWSSGILKDTIIMGVVGLLLYVFSEVFIHKKRTFLNFILMIFGIFTLEILKPILLFTLIPSFLFWGVLHLTSSIKTKKRKVLTRIVVVFGIIGLGWLVNDTFVEDSSKYKIDNLYHTMRGFQTQHPDYSIAKSNYHLGEMSYDFLGVIKKVPQAVNVTFFRPYFWEVNSLPMLLSAIETFIIILFSIYILLKTKLQVFKLILYDENILFLFSFAILYAAIIGLTAYNFGALSRFKIPVILFYMLSFIIIQLSSNDKKSTFF